ncbi:hypothetical protein LTQ55_12070 [Mycobacterium intracellulare]|uniref:hypothetical protein n=1 Tax=Mycobacterium intracellulare TaxID=1767 RepID=UPI001E5B8906|nr:hypothetical protein [Mycobacterium intracellulare]UGT99493.1 hypothetical protein LTQ55_12070 [Mycobacterium intracellulare]
MLDRVEFDVSHEPASLDHYRRDWVPGPGVSLAGIWYGAVVSDGSARDYWGVRGADDFVVGMTHVVSPICGFRSLQKTLDAEASHLFSEYASIDWYEPYTYTATGDLIQMNYFSGRIERDAAGCHWYDASGRWEIHGTTISDVVVTHVPVQPGIDHEVYYRHELMHARGTIAGVDVSGYAHQDFAYGPPGMAYTELPIARQLQGMWVSWMHEYTDGEVGGGSFWQGRDDLAFGPGYHVKDGVTTVHNDIVAMPTFNASGKIITLKARIGADSYEFTFDTNGSPVHVFGQLTSNSSGKQPARSWCWVEYAGGMMTPELLDWAIQPFLIARGA